MKDPTVSLNFRALNDVMTEEKTLEPLTWNTACWPERHLVSAVWVHSQWETSGSSGYSGKNNIQKLHQL